MPETTNHFLKLKGLLPKGYRIAIKNATGASISTINFVLRGERPDNDGIILEAYKIARNVLKKKTTNAKKLAEVQEELNKLSS